MQLYSNPELLKSIREELIELKTHAYLRQKLSCGELYGTTPSRYTKNCLYQQLFVSSVVCMSCEVKRVGVF